ncbi:MAG: hypothetical protein NT157_04715, partial [Candidatus Micrarchaeota archaeon]|nr:hypothetical protein [Candidatus Micrarchaeota archaeon]
MFRMRLLFFLGVMAMLAIPSFAAGTCSSYGTCAECADHMCVWCTKDILPACRTSTSTCASVCAGGSCITMSESCPSANEAPYIGTMTITPSPVLVGQDFSCSATVSDANGDACAVLYEVWGSGSSEGAPDGDGIASCSGSSWFAGKTCTAEIFADEVMVQLPTPVTCKLYASDIHGGSASRSGTAILQCPSGETDCSNLCKNLQT